MQPQSAPSDFWKKRSRDILTPPLGATTCPWPGVGNPPFSSWEPWQKWKSLADLINLGAGVPLKVKFSASSLNIPSLCCSPNPRRSRFTLILSQIYLLAFSFLLFMAHWLLYSNKKLSISILSYPAIQILGSSATLEILYSSAIEQSCWLNCDFAKNSPIHSVMCKTNIGSMANPLTGQCCITLSDLTSVHLASLFTLPTFCLHLIVLSIFIQLIFPLLTFPTLVHFLNYPIHSGG